MKNEDFDKSEPEVRRASKKGAVEDIIHVSSIDEGQDLRKSNSFGVNLKQEMDFNEED